MAGANPDRGIVVELATRVNQDITAACGTESDFMTKMTTALLAIALSVPAASFAQSMGQQDTSDAHAQQQKANQAAANDMNGMDTAPHQTMTGMVSGDGKTITSTDNTVYQVSNPNALKNYLNQNVTIRYQFNTGKNSIKVNKVNPGQ
jgi:uncharacterized protein YfaP (DUF2135 family)